ncbi:MAG: ParB N-terminal domain-containing protein [Planctomycetota bacterium]
MKHLPIDALEAHPENANAMTDTTFRTLQRHIARSGRYPPVIVRPHPTCPDRFEVLDGHHRVRALRELGHHTAQCITWHVDDDEARLLLLTLNRLEGEDDIERRGGLLRALAARIDVDELASWLPESAHDVRALMEVPPPPPPPAPIDERDPTHAITFFLTRHQHNALVARLRQTSRNLSASLVDVLQLDQPEVNHG